MSLIHNFTDLVAVSVEFFLIHNFTDLIAVSVEFFFMYISFCVVMLSSPLCSFVFKVAFSHNVFQFETLHTFVTLATGVMFSLM
jgi:hypothetical protein